MTLKDDGLEKARLRKPCIIARAIQTLDPGMQAEVIELFQAEVPAESVKEVLADIGIDMVAQTITGKRRGGCTCSWCIQNKVWLVQSN